MPPSPSMAPVTTSVANDNALSEPPDTISSSSIFSSRLSAGILLDICFLPLCFREGTIPSIRQSRIGRTIRGDCDADHKCDMILRLVTQQMSKRDHSKNQQGPFTLSVDG